MIRSFIKKLPGIKKIVELRNQARINKACRLLIQEGNNSLAAYNRVAEKLGIKFDVMFGTLLGVYRDHSFIPHDDDIDMVCDIKHLNQKLLDTLREEGFKIERIYVASDKTGVQLPMKYNGLTSDIYFMYDDSVSSIKHIYIPMALEGNDWCYSKEKNIFSVKDMFIPYTHERMVVPFNNSMIEIVANADEVLKALYGETYMIPKANAHANPPVRYFDLGEKYYTCYPIDLFERSNLISYINTKRIDSNTQN